MKARLRHSPPSFDLPRCMHASAYTQAHLTEASQAGRLVVVLLLLDAGALAAAYESSGGGSTIVLLRSSRACRCSLQRSKLRACKNAASSLSGHRHEYRSAIKSAVSFNPSDSDRFTSRRSRLSTSGDRAGFGSVGWGVNDDAACEAILGCPLLLSFPCLHPLVLTRQAGSGGCCSGCAASIYARTGLCLHRTMETAGRCTC